MKLYAVSFWWLAKKHATIVEAVSRREAMNTLQVDYVGCAIELCEEYNPTDNIEEEL